MEVTIRPYERRDAAGVADVFYRSAREVALSDYTPEQVEAWVPRRWDAEQEHQRSGDGRLVLVAADESGHVVAFIDLEPDGHIDRLFCAPEAAGRGVASRLYDAIVLRGVPIHNYRMAKSLSPIRVNTPRTRAGHNDLL